MGCFAIGFLNYNDHLQLIAILHKSMGVNAIKQVAWIATNATHHM
jgi:hypothetical protein